MTTNKIIDGIFAALNRIADNHISPVNVDIDTELKDMTYVTFNIKGRKRWMLAIWIYDEGEKYKVHLFGQYKWFIDKFKPSCSPFAFEFEIEKSAEEFPLPYVKGHETECPDAVFEFGYAVRGIYNSSLGSLAKYYWNEFYGGGYYEGLLKWLAEVTWFYVVRQPLANLWANKLQFIPLTVVRGMYKIRYGKKISTSIHPTPEFFSPNGEFYVIYNIDDEESDEFFDIYCDINTGGIDENRNVIYREKFIPKWLFKDISIENITRKDWDAGKRRGFYIPIKLNEDNEE